jgi:hypothetical protein
MQTESQAMMDNITKWQFQTRFQQQKSWAKHINYKVDYSEGVSTYL